MFFSVFTKGPPYGKNSKSMVFYGKPYKVIVFSYPPPQTGYFRGGKYPDFLRGEGGRRKRGRGKEEMGKGEKGKGKEEKRKKRRRKGE